jgi:hypothetical protein
MAFTSDISKQVIMFSFLFGTPDGKAFSNFAIYTRHGNDLILWQLAHLVIINIIIESPDLSSCLVFISIRAPFENGIVK